MEAGTLSCPTCGAVVSKDSTQCQHCGALLQTVACPSCFGMMFLGSKFCPHCGAAAQAIEQGPTGTHKCPRCTVDLIKIAVGTSQIEECPHCGGMWVQSQVFERICSDRESQAVATSLKLPEPVAADPTVRYLKCPQCADLMNRMNYAHRSGVIIDICRDHGIWIDRDGLRQIIEFIRAGGLDREREVEKADVERERRLAESERTYQTFDNNLNLGAGRYESSATDLLVGISSLINWFRK